MEADIYSLADPSKADILSAPNLAISKYAADRDKEAPFNRALGRSQLADENDLSRLAKTRTGQNSLNLYNRQHSVLFRAVEKWKQNGIRR